MGRAQRGEAIRQPQAGPATRGDDNSDTPVRARIDPIEREALRAAIHYPEHVGSLLATPMLGEYAVGQGIFAALVEAATLPEAIDTMDPGPRAVAERLAVEDVDEGARPRPGGR